MDCWSLTARWIVPVDGPPLAGGVVVVDGDRIAALLPQGERTADFDLGNVAVVPGFVNAHTHLDLSGLAGLCPPTPDFTAWLRGVIAHRRGQTSEQIAADIKTGLAASLAAGTTLLGDIAAGGASWEVIRGADVRAVVFLELLGLTAQRAAAAEQLAQEWLAAHPATALCRPGFSPHAPYSVRPTLFASANKLAEVAGIPLAVHLAETLAEGELLQDHGGPFVAFLQDLGVWDPSGLAGSFQEVLQTCSPPVPRLFIHGNYLPPSANLPPGSTVVYCPRTHAAFGHAPHPWRALLQRGVRVALGTDSLASNPDLDVLAEARALHRMAPDVPGPVLLRMATLAGAEALGWADETGSLSAGKSADLAVIPLPNEDGEPHALLLDSAHVAVRTLFRGRWRTQAALP